MRKVLLALALIAGLSACDQDPTDKPVVHSVQIGGKPYRCFRAGDMNINQPGTELKGAVRETLLTSAAREVGVRIFITSTEVNTYGQLVLNYVDRDNTCTLWTEGLTVQEYAQKVGLNPVGISPFYEVEKPAPVTTTPTTK